MTITFLGTGASGGTPGKGKSKRLESSIFIQNKTCILIDVTRDFSEQVKAVKHIDYILLTHGHKDAIGGIPQLSRWHKMQKPIPIIANTKTIQGIKRHYKRFNHCKFFEVRTDEKLTVGDFGIVPLEVPHTRSKDYSTFAWKITQKGKTVVYASDIASITPEFRNFCQNADVLIIDSAMWKKKIFTHLTINESLPIICQWKVKKIFLTQIGRSVPPYEILTKELPVLCPRALLSYDGLSSNL